MGKKTPRAPDYTAAAVATGKSAQQNTNTQTYADRPNQTTPFGSETWTPTAYKDPATGQTVTKWSSNTTLTPAAQAALVAQQNIDKSKSQLAQGLIGNVQKSVATPMDWSKFAPEVSSVGGGAQYNKAAGDAVYNQFSQRNEPIFAQQKAGLETQLRNQGLNPGDEAYDREIAQQAQQQNDARTNASLAATQAAGAEGSRLQSMDVTSGNFQNTARQQQIADEMQKRGYSLNEVNAVLNGQQIGMPNMPSFANASSAAPTNYEGAAANQYQSALDAANAKNAGIGNLVGAASSLGSAAMLSDRRLKTNIVQIGTHKGYPVYSFDYLWGQPSVGVMADEVPAKFVHNHNGYAMVDYGALFA